MDTNGGTPDSPSGRTGSEGKARLLVLGGREAKTAAGQRPGLNEAVDLAAERLLSLQHAPGYFVFDLEADATIPAEYVMLQRFLGRTPDPELTERIKAYLLAKQTADGGWPLFDQDGPSNLSASVKAYFALKLLGLPPEDPALAKARLCILAQGGAARCNVFTRFALALFGQMPWHTPPAMPVEIMLLPRWFFFHLSKVSYWSRTVIVPLLILSALKPVRRLDPSEGLRELFPVPPESLGHLDPFRRGPYVRGKWRKNAFLLLDRLLKRFMHLIPKAVHEKALRGAERWTREHMQGVGGIGAIFPAMANAVMALRALGRPDTDPDFVRGLAAVDDLLLDRLPPRPARPEPGPSAVADSPLAPQIEPRQGPATAENQAQSLCQPCVSPIWDTCLTLSALMEAGVSRSHPAVRSCVDWLFANQVFVKGDWADKATGLESGGWAFQFENALYPDLDDTAMVVMALARAGCLEDPEQRARIAAAVRWVLGMQSRDGGWAAFDIDNNALYLNDIPFADHGALLDPSTSDLTGRCVEMLGVLGFPRDYPPLARGIEFLRREQEAHGGWYGRWGVNYIYGTWSVLAGLRQAGEDKGSPMVRRAADWLKSCQNPDGGFGESCLSYDDPSLAGRGASTASQTAWALLGLFAAGEVNSPEAARGVGYLLENQTAEGGWIERHFTGTGFPRVFYLLYHGYSQYFPLWALAAYRRERAGRPTRQIEARLADPSDFLPRTGRS
jgi:squalene-hopene/tetraprenyl-beta-curcumene cyclase